MPKWDKTRDYYADLEVSQDASLEEIKKQFRKLALKWHPDRNPGRETEVNPRFQIIQSAHEILTDESLKRQYDDARKNHGSRFPKASNVRGNPWQDVSKQYQPPPTRYSAQSSSKQPHSGGAQRYASFAKDMPRTPRPTAREDPQSRQSYADAWENMRRSNSTRRAPPQNPGRAPTSATRDAKASDGENVPKTAYQQQKAQAAFGTRRNGYVPHSPGLADEPPVTNKNYFTTRTHSNLFNEVPPDAPASPTPDPLAKFREKVYDQRQSTPYHTPGGEKTSLFDDGPGLGRTTSTRTPKATPQMPGAFPQARPRSSSTPRSSSNDVESEDSVKFSSKGGNSSSNGEMPNGNGASQSRASERYKPKSSQANVASQPQTGTAGSASTASTNAGEGMSLWPNLKAWHANLEAKAVPGAGGNSAQATNGPSVYATCTPLSYLKPNNHQARPTGPTASIHREAEQASNLPSSNPRDPSSGGVAPQQPSLYTFERGQRIDVRRLIDLHRFRAVPSPNTGNVSVEKQAAHPSNLTQPSSKRAKTNTNRSTSFYFTVENDADRNGVNTEGLARHSSDNINTRFAKDELPDGLKFSAGIPTMSDEFQTSMKARPNARSRVSRRPVPKARQPQADHAPSMQEGLGNAAGQGFSAGQWSDKIGSQHFEPQAARSTSASPTRRPNVKKSKPVKMTAGSAGLVDEDDNEDWQEIPGPSSGPTAASVDGATAMDIDSPPPEKADDTPKASQTNGARKIPVEPHREEWRAGDVNGVRTKSSSPMQDENSANGPSFAQSAIPQSTSVPATQPFAAQPGGSEDTEEFRTILSDFNKVEPFVDPSPAGLGNFGDLKSTLPFPSRPSEHLPLEKEYPVKPMTLEFPAPPVAPRLPPSSVTPGLRPTQLQFRKYAQDFYQYMDKWESFNAKIIQHFSTRQENFRARRQQRGAAWLDTTLSSSDPARDYLVELEQDQAVRQQWAHAHADHQMKVREFMKFRDQVR
ncbi:hypothetical protein F4677DRAFT_464679 [Hypoxylon crocopeplum]|nr:hypothetical protein F4677DRAFT_464679 [Hypoxylon crocopeplum]